MRLVARVLSIILVLIGLGILTSGLTRSRLPYEDGRYFDARTQVVYHAETAELLVIVGVVLTLAGVVIAILAALSRRVSQHRASFEP